MGGKAFLAAPRVAQTVGGGVSGPAHCVFLLAALLCSLRAVQEEVGHVVPLEAWSPRTVGTLVAPFADPPLRPLPPEVQASDAPRAMPHCQALAFSPGPHLTEDFVSVSTPPSPRPLPCPAGPREQPPQQRRASRCPQTHFLSHTQGLS